MKTIGEIVKAQHKFFDSNLTKDVKYRIEQLKKIKFLLKKNEPLLYEAIYNDFGKSEFETYMAELSLVYHETNQFIKKIKSWSRSKRVASGLANFPAKSYIMPEPLGNVLVIGAWNYPFQLSLLPAITAIAAGNTVVIKPSELPSNTSRVMADIINPNFPPEFFCVVEGGVKETTELLEQKFDKIFFTGSIPVGRIVYQAAAKNMTPVTLELGGKSPTFVLADCNLKMTAKRLVWGKFINAGQTCVAPDYILVERAIKEKFIKALINELKDYPKEADEQTSHYLQIINEKNFDRLVSLIDEDKVCYGNNQDREQRFISPTIMHNVSFTDKVMEDEIFGPILPIIEFDDLNDAIQRVKERPKPLSCYIYSKNRRKINKILMEISFGGGAVNDSVMHLSNSRLPFGGVGFSGIGSYHGKYGFDTFTHYKSILQKANWFESAVKYAPYSKLKLKLIKFLME